MKNNTKKLRKSKKITQVELSNMVHVTRQTIIAIEKNKYDPSLKLAFSLAYSLDTTVDELFIFSEDD
ncbi:helix-turn-helix transcriptional regulator [Enterococcus thailandicus]|uniref:Transcriptional regulator n=1 Tax=Enterococcus thailandicus TaxID=417368 RepID=A0A179ENT5_ENTTH|nr:helix-turn-helix transcriptional regulator [Enterococcus thailandicus]MDA3965892.1 helix-turn-helix transcriptional regulator [Enterococcus thailandicus]MDT2750933.1 helix-turn-helix transcriptional regulator [Enterococcus thailandicus]MDT2775740.1 helix-turn-helix transcriptional regulator [Enterococcus thailandicus]MDT2794601.1 helix-turn-helix transcriptional regulator [Enterococcus thailandicus]MDT2845122.1 helix-turn-helix transcriptional regulator [Enterococcus thailandicus]